MKKKSKGFMLVELIVTSTIVVAAMVTLYASFNRIYSLYKTKNNYYSIDGVYATKEMTKNLIFNNKINDLIREAMDKNKYTNKYTYIIKDNKCIKEDDKICNGIQSFYNVKNMIFIEYDKNTLTSDKTESDFINDEKIKNNETFKDYIKYVVNYYDITDSDTSFSYIILTETEENGKNYYSNLRIR